MTAERAREEWKTQDELWGITCCFNPAGYANKYTHLQRFAAHARAQGLKLLVVELAIRDQPFSVPDHYADRIIRLRSNTVLWHKERLLNLAVEALPAGCSKVVCVDADLLFENENWVSETLALLDRYAVIQPFQFYCPLTRDLTAQSQLLPESVDTVPQVPGLAYAKSELSDAETPFSMPGGVWAFQRSLLHRHGLYDRFILGGGDAALGWAVYGETESWLARGWMPAILSDALVNDLRLWSKAFSHDAGGTAGYLRGRVCHMWHGDPKDRRYVMRLAALRTAEFDPNTDLALDENRCWQWSSDKPQLHKNVEDYFRARKEEG